MNKRFYILIALAAGFCACSNDDDKLLQEEPAPVRKISIEVIENPMVIDGTKGSLSATRGSVISTSSLNAFSMNYQNTIYSLSKSGDAWTPNPISWPYGVEDETPITFRAYNGGEYQYSGDYISFTIDENADKQKDLLVATDNVSYKYAQGKVTLAFNHACAAVDFQLCISNKLRTALGTDLSINSVTLVNIKNTGKYYYSTGWSGLDGSAYYTLTNSVFSLGTSLQTLGCGTLFLIPQTFGTDTGLRINYTVSGNQKETFVSMAGYELKAGNQYTANIKLGTAHIN
jgi:hypothetical protein